MYALRLAGCFHLRALKTFVVMGWLTDFMSATPSGRRFLARADESSRRGEARTSPRQRSGRPSITSQIQPMARMSPSTALPTTLTTIPSSVDSEANTEAVAPALSAVEGSAWPAFADAD